MFLSWTELAEIKGACDELAQASHKLAEMIYSKASEAEAKPEPEEKAAGPGEEKVVDADFEEVKEEENKKEGGSH